ncbi:MAG: hypothetical protein Q9227_006635, partial [Pyrenula ochraceoflavens]
MAETTPRAPPTAPLFRSNAIADPIPSSSPAFATPAHPIIPVNRDGRVKASAPAKMSILPVLLQPAVLRPIAFRTITKKHNLTITSSALQELSTFIGRNCGSGWREEGLAEKVLDEVAKQWKRNGGGVMLEDGPHKALTSILQNLQSCMSGGRIQDIKRSNSIASVTGFLSRQNSLDVSRPAVASREDSQTSLGLSNLEVSDDDDDDESLSSQSARVYMKVISAYDQPRLEYNTTKKFFEHLPNNPSLFPPPSHKTKLFRSRYNLIHQRLLRNESFQTPAFSAASRTSSLQRSTSTLATQQQSYKITSIANLLGRSGSSHLLLGLLARAPTGDLALTDLTGSIMLDLRHARAVPEDGAWFCPGMISLVEGIYEEEGGSTVGNNSGVGGMIGGRFLAASIGGPPCERREATLGIGSKGRSGENRATTAGAGFGWIDFLGTGSEKAQGQRMRRIQSKVHGRAQRRRDGSQDEDVTPKRTKLAVFAEVHLDNPRVLAALRRIFTLYSLQSTEDIPLAFIFMGSFVGNAAMAGSEAGGSIEYKEHFDALASLLSEFPAIISMSTLIFVPGDNDPWVSAFSGGAATAIPREGIPALFTSRIRRAVAAANAEKGGSRNSGSEAGE